MSQSLRDQLLKKGVVKPEDTAEAKRERERLARPKPTEDKELPPLFEPAPRGVIKESPPKKNPPR